MKQNYQKYGKTRHPRELAKKVRIAHTQFLEDGGHPYEKPPVVTLTGTVKLHGMFAAICYSPTKGVFSGSRLTKLSPLHHSEGQGFSGFVHGENAEVIENYIKSVWTYLSELVDGSGSKVHNLNDCHIQLCGEWAGKGIQSGTAGITKIEKSYFLFDGYIYNNKTDEKTYFDISTLSCDIENFYNIHQFKTFTLEFDTGNPQNSQQRLFELTKEVENNCPVSIDLGVKRSIITPLLWWQIFLNYFIKYFTTPYEAKYTSIVGEGIVWRTVYKGQRFNMKTKGEEHAKSKVKAVKEPSVLTKNIAELLDKVCTVSRMEQMMRQEVAVSRQDTGKYLAAFQKDVLEEDMDYFIDAGLTWKDVSTDANTRARVYFFTQIEGRDLAKEFEGEVISTTDLSGEENDVKDYFIGHDPIRDYNEPSVIEETTDIINHNECESKPDATYVMEDGGLAAFDDGDLKDESEDNTEELPSPIESETVDVVEEIPSVNNGSDNDID
jgi:hypothetical protein